MFVAKKEEREREGSQREKRSEDGEADRIFTIK